jgi:hypothetical protein
MSLQVANGSAPAAPVEQKTGQVTQASDTSPSVTSPAKPEGEKPADPATPEEKPEDKRLASKFAALSRKEREILKRDQALKARESKVIEFEKDQELKAKDPIAWAEKHGIKYSTWTERILAGKPDATAEKVKELEAKLKKDEDAKLEAEKTAEQAKVQAQIDKFKDGIKSHVDAAAEKYELVAAEEAYDVVYALIEQHFEATTERDESGEIITAGRIMSIEEACDAVEGHLFEEAQKLLKLKKLGPKPTEEKKPDGKTGQVPNSTDKPMKTLTNAISSEQPAQTEVPISVEESKRRAAALIKWNR